MCKSALLAHYYIQIKCMYFYSYNRSDAFNYHYQQAIRLKTELSKLETV